MFWKIVKGDYSMDKVEWDAISGDAKRLVSDMVTFCNNFVCCWFVVDTIGCVAHVVSG